jgi:hypothetical protein
MIGRFEHETIDPEKGLFADSDDLAEMTFGFVVRKLHVKECLTQYEHEGLFSSHCNPTTTVSADFDYRFLVLKKMRHPVCFPMLMFDNYGVQQLCGSKGEKYT